MADYNKEDKTPELVKIKIENLQKVCTEYSDQKRQNIDNADNSTSYNTVDLYDNNNYVKKSPNNVSMPTIEEPNKEPADDKSTGKFLEEETNHVEETTQEVENAVNLPPVTAEDEFIPIGARGKVHWKFVLTAATTDKDISGKGPGSLTNAVIQVETFSRRRFKMW